MDDILTWILMGVGIVGFELAGRKVWWAWYVNIANQVLWLVFAIITNYWGFIVGTVFYTYQFSRNAYKWTKEHFEVRDITTHNAHAFKREVMPIERSDHRAD